MPRIAVGLTNLFTSDLISEHSDENSNLPAENVADARPAKLFENGTAYTFEVDSTNKYLDVDTGGGEQTATLVEGSYTASGLATQIQTQLTAIDVTFTCTYGVAASNTFSINRGAGNFDILWKTGTHGSDNTDDHAGTLIGYADSADDTGLSTHTANQKRWGSHVWIKYDAGAGQTLDPSAFVFQLSSEQGDGGVGPASFSDVAIYGHASDLGDTREDWSASASETVSNASARPTYSVNTIQVAYRTAGTGYRFWFFSWKFEEEKPLQYHRINTLRAYSMVGSSTRTCRPLRRAELVDPSESFGPGNLYPVQLTQYFRLPVDLARWEDSEYRTLAHGIARHGKTEPAFVAVNWAGSNSITDGTLNAEDEADKGLMLYCSFPELPRDSYTGEGSEYISGGFVAQQVP